MTTQAIESTQKFTKTKLHPKQEQSIAPNRSEGYFPGSFFKRRERLLVGDNGFYYRIRGGAPIGPFVTETEAYADLYSFLNIKKEA